MNDRLDNGVPDSEQAEKTDVVLSGLFGEDTVEMASLIDAADLNMDEQIIKSIGDGVAALKQLKGRHGEQVQMIENMESGERLLLCLWIRDMGLLEKITEL